MVWSFAEWTPDDDPGFVWDVTQEGAWDAIVDFYTGGADSKCLRRIVEIAKGHGVQTVVVEQRYIDIDWRSEHAAFYGHTFERYPSICHRLHFFTCRLLDSNLGSLTSDLASSYRGYTVMRPLPYTPVGRTMLAPPEPLASEGVVCLGEDTVDLFGIELKIRAMPFVSQDAEYLRCAHATLWMVLYHEFLTHKTNRQLPVDVHEASMGGVVVGRQVPSEGLSIHQILAAANTLGLSPQRLNLPNTAEESSKQKVLSLHGILCRSINSQFAPIVISPTHAWIVCGYRRKYDDTGDHPIELWRHDDSRGPYLKVGDPWNDSEPYSPWKVAILPMQQKIYMTAERAELTGRLFFSGHLKHNNCDDLIRRAANRDTLTYRTYAIRSTQFRQQLDARGVGADLSRFYRLMNLPRYIWVVEAVDRDRRKAGLPDVMGEALLNSTASTHHGPLQASMIAFHAGSHAQSRGPDHKSEREIDLEVDAFYASGRPGRTLNPQSPNPPATTQVDEAER